MVGSAAVGAAALPTNLSATMYMSAIAITTIMMKSSLRPVCIVIDFSRSTCFSSLRPSGVNSKAQAKTSTSGKPRTRNKTKIFRAQWRTLLPAPATSRRPRRQCPRGLRFYVSVRRRTAFVVSALPGEAAHMIPVKSGSNRNFRPFRQCIYGAVKQKSAVRPQFPLPF